MRSAKRPPIGFERNFYKKKLFKGDFARRLYQVISKQRPRVNGEMDRGHLSIVNKNCPMVRIQVFSGKNSAAFHVSELVCRLHISVHHPVSSVYVLF